jgi:threonylcarbamoyladenosine tRNA methylthiotransferase MtaB
MRIRLSSIEPEHASEELISLFSNPALCPHLHIPLQSGSCSVLNEMGRKCSIERYAEVVCKFRKAIPFGSVTTDLLVGYPTETDKDFQQTCESVKEFGFERVHVFRYSKRPGTRAALLKPLSVKVTREREKELFKLCSRVADERWRRFIGRSCVVAIETNAMGYGEAYQRIRLVPNSNETRGLQVVKLSRYEAGLFDGERI